MINKLGPPSLNKRNHWYEHLVDKASLVCANSCENKIQKKQYWTTRGYRLVGKRDAEILDEYHSKWLGECMRKSGL